SGRLRLERRGVEVDARGVSSVVYLVAVLLGAPSGEVVLRRGPFGLRAALRVAGRGFYSGGGGPVGIGDREPRGPVSESAERGRLTRLTRPFGGRGGAPGSGGCAPEE